ncbi:unnamed protein product [Prunus armeniaca]
MVSKSQSKEAQVSKAQSKDLAVLKAQMNEDKAVQRKTSKKMRFTSTAEKDPNSSTTFDEEPKSTRGMNTMSRVVKRKIQKIKPVVEYNKRGRPHGKAVVEMQSYIGVLARTRVPLVDKKWTDLGSCSNGLCCWAMEQEDGAIVCRQEMEGFQVYLNK